MGVTTKIDTDSQIDWQQRLQGTNINSNTLLATDYLNHFNEVIMLIEMLPDMPDMLDMVLEWQPKTYQQHFADSSFTDKDLAIEAYDFAPEDSRCQFEAIVACLDGNVWKTQKRLEELGPAAPQEALAAEVATTVEKLHRLVEMISSIINGGQSDATPDEPPVSTAQAEIDALF